MNFYKRFIGDIQAKTGGLTLAEFGAYDRLLDHYYSTEQPIAPKEAHRICRAMSGAERAAVDSVLARFWDETPEGYIQSKADEVIAKAKPLIEAARVNGKKGGRPKKENPTETQPVSIENPAETQQEPSAKASQSQSQSQSQSTASLRSAVQGACALLPGIPEALVADYLEVRKAKRGGKFTATAVAGLQREASKAGVTLERALQACCEYSWIGFNSRWYAERQATAAARMPASFAEREREVGMRRWEEMTGQVHPDRSGTVIDMPATPALRIAS